MVNSKIKRTLIALIVVLVTIGCSVFSASIFARTNAANDLNNTTAAEIHYINDVDDLIAFRNNVNAGDSYAGDTVNLNADIDLSSVSSWIPIGGYDSSNSSSIRSSFQGTFNGNRHIIRNININLSAGGPVGFFGHTENANINDLMLYGLTINTISSVNNPQNYAVGSLVGYANSTTITGCLVIRTSVQVQTQNEFSGMIPSISALIGRTQGNVTISQCGVQDASITFTERTDITQSVSRVISIGGLVGEAYGDSLTVSQSYYHGDISINLYPSDDSYADYLNVIMLVGGLVGRAVGIFPVNISNSFSAVMNLTYPEDLGAENPGATGNGTDSYNGRKSIDSIFAGHYDAAMATYATTAFMVYDFTDDGNDVYSYNWAVNNINDYNVAVGTDSGDVPFVRLWFTNDSGVNITGTNSINVARPSNNDTINNNPISYLRQYGKDLYEATNGITDFQKNVSSNDLPAVYASGYMNWNISCTPFSTGYAYDWYLPIRSDICYGLPIPSAFCESVTFRVRESDYELGYITTNINNSTISTTTNDSYIVSATFTIPRIATLINWGLIYGNASSSAIITWGERVANTYSATGGGCYLNNVIVTNNFLLEQTTGHNQNSFELRFDLPSVTIFLPGRNWNSTVTQTKDDYGYTKYTYSSSSAIFSDDCKGDRENYAATYTVNLITELVFSPGTAFIRGLQAPIYYEHCYSVHNNNVLLIYAPNGYDSNENDADNNGIGDYELSAYEEFRRSAYDDSYPVAIIEYPVVDESSSNNVYLDFVNFVDHDNGNALLSGEINRTVYIYAQFIDKQITVNLSLNTDTYIQNGTLTHYIPGYINSQNTYQVSFTFIAQWGYVELEPSIVGSELLRGFAISNGNNSNSVNIIIYYQWNNLLVPWYYYVNSGAQQGPYTTETISLAVADLGRNSDNESIINIIIDPELIEYTMHLWTGYNSNTEPSAENERSIEFTYVDSNRNLSEYQPDDITVDGYAKSFGAWLIGYNGNYIVNYNGDRCYYSFLGDENYFTTYQYNESSNILTITRSFEFFTTHQTTGQWLFTVVGTIDTLNGSYFIVTDLLPGSWGDIDYNVGTEYDSASSDVTNSPFVITKWSNTYEVIVNSGTGSTWNNMATPTDYYGVYGEDASNNSPAVVFNNDTQLTLYIKALNDRYNFRFMTSEYNGNGLSMLNREELTSLGNSYYASSYLPTNSDNSAYYYIFNYGYMISAYRIYFVYDGYYYYLDIVDNNWTYDAVDPNNINQFILAQSITVSIEDINSLQATSPDLSGMALYAEYLDNLFAFGLPSGTEIYLEPIWEAVTVDIQSGTSNLWTGLFNTNYDANINSTQGSGQSLAYFTNGANRENIVMPSTDDVRFNYYNLTYSYSNGSYILNVTPYYVDNIYRVYLEGALPEQEDPNENNEYTFTLYGTVYAFSSSENVGDDYYNHRNYQGYTTYSNSGYSYATNYANAMQTVINNYENSINAGSHDLLRKVYTDGTISENSLSITSSTNNPTMYIYLANGKSTGSLPQFQNESVTTLYWLSDINYPSLPIYIYTTANYNSTEHTIPQYSRHEDGTWYLSDNYLYTNGEYNVVFEMQGENIPEPIRNYSYLSINTYLGGNLGPYGYVRVDIIDKNQETAGTAEDCSASYLVIYDLGTMRYFDITNVDLSSLADVGSVWDLTLAQNIILYADCDIQLTIYDQSQDPTAMLTGDYLQMIGYRYVNTESIVNNVTSNLFSFEEYSYSVTAQQISEQNLALGTYININVYFENIEYSLTVSMSSGNTSQGTFHVSSSNGDNFMGFASATLTGLTVSDNISITYLSAYGYEFASDAFTLVLTDLLTGEQTTIVLKTYQNLKDEANEGEYCSQEFSFIIDGEWLLTNYYSQVDESFSVANTNIGTIYVNTAEIVFDYYVRLIDNATSQLLSQDPLSEIYISTWAISDRYVSLANAFSYQSARMGYVVPFNGNYYAAIYSYAYQPRNQTDIDQYYYNYEFLLLNENATTREYNISNMLNIMTLSQQNIILADEYRNIYMCLAVSEIIEIQLQVVEGDHNPGFEREVTISNSNNNSATLTVSSDCSIVTTIYSYVGLTNSLSATYNTNVYSGVTYTYYTETYPDEGTVVESGFSASESGVLRAEFIARPLTYEIEYYIDDTQVESAEISSLVNMTVISPSQGAPLYYCTRISHTDGQISLFLRQQAYTHDLYVYMNGVNQPLEYEQGEWFILRYSVTQNDCIEGKVVIRIVERSLEAESIAIEFALTNSNLSTQADDFGTFNISINGATQTGDANELNSYSAYLASSISLTLNLNTGYTYYNVRLPNGTIQELSIVNGRIILTNNLTQDQIGTYRIYIDKVRIDAEFTIGDESEKIYTMSVDRVNGDGIGNLIVNEDRSVLRLEDLYLGKTITLSRTATPVTERFNYYYYITSDGEQVILPNNTITITSDLLETIDDVLYLYVSTTPRYYLEIVVESGEEYINVNRTDFYELNNHIYYDDGSVVTLIVEPIEQNRYYITITGDAQVSGYTTIQENITLNRNKIVYINVSPVAYDVNYNEYLYNTIDSIEEGAILVEADSIEMSGQTYLDTATLGIQINKTDRVLYIVELNIYDVTLTINLETGEVTSDANITYSNGVITVGDDQITVTQSDMLTLQYVTKGTVGLNLYYKTIEEITPNVTE